MYYSVEINNKPVRAKKGETILELLNRTGIKIPTLCSMSGFLPSGACRMCVVEVDGFENLVPACSYPVVEWMKIQTHSPRVIKARKTIVELLLSNHPDDCLYCERSSNCELQRLAEDLYIRERRIPGKKSRKKIDKSGPGLVRDPEKCILCGRCVRVCEEEQGVAALDFAYRGSKTAIATAMNKSISFSNCIQCGQCITVCPTGALTDKTQFGELENALNDKNKIKVAFYSPVVAITLAEEFGFKPGKDISGLINALLRKLGFTKIFNTSFGADIVLHEEAALLAKRAEEIAPWPLFSSNCPAWVKYAEQTFPELLEHLSNIRSPQQTMGALVKNFMNPDSKTDPSGYYTVSITPCTAGKFENQRIELCTAGLPDVDCVITTRELARLIRINGIDLHSLEPEHTDKPFGMYSASGKLFFTPGGHTEGLIRTFYHHLTGKEFITSKISVLRHNKGIKEFNLEIAGKNFGFAAVNGLKNLKLLLEEIKNGTKRLHFVEVMACKNGCIAGGGQPVKFGNDSVKPRLKSFYEDDEKASIKIPAKNPVINNFFNETEGVTTKEILKAVTTTFSTKHTL